ncbi:MAG: ABC transporter permease subunit, partial [Acidimicrobiales bacterium]
PWDRPTAPMTAPVSTALPPAKGAKPPLWRDVRVLRVAFQVAVVAIIGLVLLTLVANVRTNSERLGIPTGFEYLDNPAQFPIPDSDFRQTQPVRDAIVEGLGNTLRVVLLGIVMATVVGVLVGVGRLSGNLLVRTAARIYVEILRNVPLLLLIYFSYFALALTTFPRVAEAWEPLGLAVLSNRGVVVPWVDGGVAPLVVGALVALVVGLGIARWRSSVADATGAPTRTARFMLPAVLLVLALAWLLSGLGLSLPERDANRVGGGIRMSPEYFAIFFALVIYTASHIAEIVRGSIQAVDRGQGEAASALALSSTQRLRYVVLPQAFRIAVPPIGNQYLNLMKNSTLGAVVGYFELARVTAISVGNGAPAIPSYLLLLGIFLVLSLVLSVLVNIVNRRLALVER